jgi:hypothetical protein
VTCYYTQGDVCINVIGFASCLTRSLSVARYLARIAAELCAPVSTPPIWSPSSANATWEGVVPHQKPAYVAQERDKWRALSNLLLHTVRGISWLASQGHCCTQLASNHSVIRQYVVGPKVSGERPEELFGLADSRLFPPKVSLLWRIVGAYVVTWSQELCWR